ncbi:helix-turn-helix domain-containing protein [Pseudovibrio exalbescens]|uniref:helix-turn-helix domain-containing protein n=1 Tax=Pseudovibrio exalbescens TaxID=197461 RepID=UPI001F3BFBA2
MAAARALLGMSQSDLSERTNVSVPTLRRMEASKGPITGYINNVRAVVAALEAEGIVFVQKGDLVTGQGISFIDAD